MALVECTKEALYLRSLLIEIGLKELAEHIEIYGDNLGAQKLAKNNIFHSRTKHIDVRHHFLREKVSDEVILLKYLKTEEMPADALTKTVGKTKLLRDMKRLGVE